MSYTVPAVRFNRIACVRMAASGRVPWIMSVILLMMRMMVMRLMAASGGTPWIRSVMRLMVMRLVVRRLIRMVVRRLVRMVVRRLMRMVVRRLMIDLMFSVVA